MTREEFKAKVMAQLELAEKNKADELNVLDLRLYVNDCMAGVYDVKHLDELYEYVIQYEDWFIDIYENIHGENRAEFADFVIWPEGNVDIRKCCTCGKPMKKGYYIDGEYACSERCAIVYYTEWSDYNLEN